MALEDLIPRNGKQPQTSASPQERLRAYGAEALTDRDLVEMLAGAKAATYLRDGLPALAYRGQGPPRLRAALELGRRLYRCHIVKGDPVTSAHDIAPRLIEKYGLLPQERLGAVYLDGRNRLLDEREIYIGTVNHTTVSTRDVFRIGLEQNAAAVILYHNHPSGDPNPSYEDIGYTKQAYEAGRLLDINLLDHLIIGYNRYVSLKERGAL